MEKNSKIYVAGHNGMVGSAIVRELKKQGYENIITRSHKELDLCRQDKVEEFFAAEKPKYVFLAAAKVGGIVANQNAPADFMYENMILEMNVIHSAWKNSCKKLEFLGSSCIYPRMAPQPMKEICLLTSELEKTNEAYALAKISGLKYCEFLNRQYGTDYISVMPTNLYGPNDNYHPMHSHVLPALIRRFHEAKAQGSSEVVCWGDGSPLREFLYVDDLANLCVFLMNNYSGNETVNAGTGKELTIKELTDAIPDVHSNETMLAVMNTLALNLVMWFFFVFIYRRSYKTHPYRPWILWLLASAISCGSVAYVCFKRADDSELGYGLIGVIIVVFTLSMLLYVNHKQIKQSNETIVRFSGRSLNRDGTALIIGDTSDIGKWLVEILLEKNYRVFGIHNSTSDNTNQFIEYLNKPSDNGIPDNNAAETFKQLDAKNITEMILSYKPTEIYNFSALTDFSYCKCGNNNCNNMVEATKVFNAIKDAKIENFCRYFQASTTSLYCFDTDEIINELSPFKPLSVRSVMEAYSAWMVRVYREKENFFAVNGILFAHESEKSSPNSLIHKIVNEASEISNCPTARACLSHPDMEVDIGYTKDYARAIWLSLQKNYSTDYVFATGKLHSIREIYSRVFKEMHMPLIWEGKGFNEIGKSRQNGNVFITVPSNCYSTFDGYIKCDPTKSEEELELNYNKTLFEEMIKLIVQETEQNNASKG